MNPLHTTPLIFSVLLMMSGLLQQTQATPLNKDHNVYKIIKGEGNQKESTAYFHKLLQLALNQTIDDYGTFELDIINFRVPQNRTLRLLNEDDLLDVTYSMTSPSREQDYIAIKQPLLKGLFGKRRLLVLKERKEEFDNLSEPELKSLVACQGLHWPDVNILKNNGFSVYGVNDFEANLKMLSRHRCDYFPRGIHEIESDFKKYNGRFNQLAMVDNIMLQYHAPLYYFVGKQNKALAERIKIGLDRLANAHLPKDIFEEMLHDSKGFSYSTTFEHNPKLKVFKLKSLIN